jgi:hypothetical protein
MPVQCPCFATAVGLLDGLSNLHQWPANKSLALHQQFRLHDYQDGRNPR